ncbi:YetF domain-containing protein [Pseudomonas sp. RIT-PI-S]|uniref:DUF421 domain-containing protein n=1 Tax=Pseudomonas sp. RIT-PI-S TaxID=3035295 RepID=UPI0021DA0C14|nr:YetF domain-containing protein [Pseudomonas sp. RIT-PI-S]
MDAALRAGAMYIALIILFKIAGRRSLVDLTTFDFVLLLIIGEATQQALLGDDFSFTNAVLVIATLFAMDIGFSMAKERFDSLSKLLDDGAIILVENGRPLSRRLQKARLTEDDIMETARTNQGVERMEDIRYAILERNGSISIIKN